MNTQMISFSGLTGCIRVPRPLQKEDRQQTRNPTKMNGFMVWLASWDEDIHNSQKTLCKHFVQQSRLKINQLYHLINGTGIHKSQGISKILPKAGFLLSTVHLLTVSLWGLDPTLKPEGMRQWAIDGFHFFLTKKNSKQTKFLVEKTWKNVQRNHQGGKPTVIRWERLVSISQPWKTGKLETNHRLKR